ncbi:MAG: Na(+)-translocating NADH-quinone reductase subunit C [SAR324 cluster bacterium]|nr:Na(+)-translocating NADH-quinone reductase subunit C [SAR324 cluster bacterium]
MKNETIAKTLLVATTLCVACSILVSSAAVALKPIQEKNKLLDAQKNILEAAGLMTEGGDITALFSQVEVKLIDIETGKLTEAVDAKTFDAKKAAKNPDLSIKIDQSNDIAKIKRRAKYANVYLVNKDGKLDTVILPLYGKALWSTMYAFVALKSDGSTVKGFTFYEHGETPGLGGEVDNPLWKKQWPGKKMFDDKQNLKIHVLKSKVNLSDPEAVHQIDGLGGATLTTRGVENLIRYWMGKDGFAPFLENLRKGEING